MEFWNNIVLTSEFMGKFRFSIGVRDGIVFTSFTKMNFPF